MPELEEVIIVQKQKVDLHDTLGHVRIVWKVFQATLCVTNTIQGSYDTIKATLP